MVNALIRSSTFPTEWKTATVTPLIKKPDSDPEDMKNFRPVSNLSYISKLTEKIVMKQIDEHLDNNNLTGATTKCIQKQSQHRNSISQNCK